ncbi:hypothetical protein B0H67DRAFT_341654 [Lasiosphaeris hirsuta]|uniref:Uncharacterized protein n=1 Tax=Lasiosphaeris hirsuta TaxID=260670 RepID=A0AA40DLU8_9PEZI|nr:hypothetical protein B0H67DRAFT_341654 [Lasiosphaeris hirsuta]
MQIACGKRARPTMESCNKATIKGQHGKDGAVPARCRGYIDPQRPHTGCRRDDAIGEDRRILAEFGLAWSLGLLPRGRAGGIGYDGTVQLHNDVIGRLVKHDHGATWPTAASARVLERSRLWMAVFHLFSAAAALGSSLWCGKRTSTASCCQLRPWAADGTSRPGMPGARQTCCSRQAAQKQQRQKRVSPGAWRPHPLLAAGQMISRIDSHSH